MEKGPLVSIVMPSFNQVKYINSALDSILSQDELRLEIIIQDGCSTDGTCELLRSRSEEDPRIVWQSEIDSGPADAINKALKRTKGTIIGWLNSDDLYEKGAIERAVNMLHMNSNLIMCYGKGQHIDQNGIPVAEYPTQPDMVEYTDIPDKRIFQTGCFICQPTVFFKRTLWMLLGSLDCSLKASFDFDYWLRAFNVFEGRIGFINELQANTRLHIDTITYKQRLTVAIEGMQILAKHQGQSQSHWIISYIDEQLSEGIRPLVIYNELINCMSYFKSLLSSDDEVTLLEKKVYGLCNIKERNNEL